MHVVLDVAADRAGGGIEGGEKAAIDSCDRQEFRGSAEQ